MPIIIIDKTKLDALPPSQAERREKSDVKLIPGSIIRRNKCHVCGKFFEDIAVGVLCPACKTKGLEDYNRHLHTSNGNLPPTVDRIVHSDGIIRPGFRKKVHGDETKGK